MTDRTSIPAPRKVPWQLKPFHSARTEVSYDEYGRMVLFIEHDIIRGVSPEMIDDWFRNIAGDVEIDGEVINRYLAWHPTDHIRWELARPAPGGGAAKGAYFRIVEMFDVNPDFMIDVVEKVTRLDSSGITLVNHKFGLEVSRLNHDFHEMTGGTRYVSTLSVGVALPFIGLVVNPLIHNTVFSEKKGRAWLKHNIEEVGAFEHLLPRLHAARL